MNIRLIESRVLCAVLICGKHIYTKRYNIFVPPIETSLFAVDKTKENENIYLQFCYRLAVNLISNVLSVSRGQRRGTAYLNEKT